MKFYFVLVKAMGICLLVRGKLYSTKMYILNNCGLLQISFQKTKYRILLGAIFEGECTIALSRERAYLSVFWSFIKFWVGFPRILETVNLIKNVLIDRDHKYQFVRLRSHWMHTKANIFFAVLNLLQTDIYSFNWPKVHGKVTLLTDGFLVNSLRYSYQARQISYILTFAFDQCKRNQVHWGPLTTSKKVQRNLVIVLTVFLVSTCPLVYLCIFW